MLTKDSLYWQCPWNMSVFQTCLTFVWRLPCNFTMDHIASSDKCLTFHYQISHTLYWTSLTQKCTENHVFLIYHTWSGVKFVHYDLFADGLHEFIATCFQELCGIFVGVPFMTVGVIWKLSCLTWYYIYIYVNPHFPVSPIAIRSLIW